MSGASEVPALLPCPFCGDAMQNRRGLVMHTDANRQKCIIGANGIPVEWAERWNTRASRPVDTGREKALGEAAERVIDLLCSDPAKDEAAAERVCAAFDARWKGGMMFERISDMGKALAVEIRALANPENGRG